MNRQAGLLSLCLEFSPPVKPSMHMCSWLLPLQFLAVLCTSSHGRTIQSLKARENLLTVMSCIVCQNALPA